MGQNQILSLSQKNNIFLISGTRTGDLKPAKHRVKMNLADTSTRIVVNKENRQPPTNFIFKFKNQSNNIYLSQV